MIRSEDPRWIRAVCRGGVSAKGGSWWRKLIAFWQLVNEPRLRPRRWRHDAD